MLARLLHNLRSGMSVLYNLKAISHVYVKLHGLYTYQKQYVCRVCEIMADKQDWAVRLKDYVTTPSPWAGQSLV